MCLGSFCVLKLIEFGDMLSNAKLPFLLSLILLFLLWKETQGRCSSCPSNGCSQTGMSEGKCYKARYYRTSYQTSYYVKTYYTETSRGSSTYGCGIFRWKRCTRYHMNYRKSSRSTLRYRTRYRSNRACDAYCCTGHKKDSNGRCIVDCGTPRSLSNGQRRYSSTTVRSRVTYSCNSGYLRTAGSSSRTCQSNGQWSGTHPTCTRSCGTPSSLSNGQRSYSSTIVRSRVTYTCNTGYLRTAGSSSRTCQSNGQWSGSHPTCTRSCGTPRSLSNGQRSYSSTIVGSRVTYTCNTGYLRTAGSSSRTCQSSGQWSGSHPTCTRSCGTPSSLSNGQRSYSSTTVVGSRVTYTCNTGYLRTAGSSSRTCRSDGQWSGSHPTCTRSCGTPRSLSNGQRRYSSTTFGYTVTYTCNSGYLRTAGSSSRTCQSDGRWSGSHPTCTRSCGTPRSLSNGQRRYSSTTVGSTVTYTCNSGYSRTAGSSSRTCQSSGQWSGTHPTCTRNNGDIQLIGGSMSRQGRVEIWYNSQWNTVCDDSWDLNDANVVCQQLGYRGAVTAHQSAHFGEGSGQILLDDLQCTGREASLLECSHSGINDHNCEHSEDASVTCTTSRFSSRSLRLANGSVPSVGRVELWYSDQWNTVCDDSWDINEANVVCQQLGYRGETFAHRSAYFGRGSGEILLDNLECTGTESSLFQCPHNGYYNHNCGHGEDAGVTCGCGDPGTRADINRIIGGTAVGDTVTYTCPTGYILSGSSSRVCLTSGYWSGNLPTCNIVTCSLLPIPTNGQRLGSRRNYNDRVSFSCNTGYNLRGSSSRTCQSTGQWSGTQPTCDGDCGDIRIPDNATVSVSGTTVGQIVTYTCNSGYELMGNSTRTCQSSGQWTGSQPSCSDLNECETGQHNCNPNTSVCFNSAGSYSCVCRSGFEDFVNRESGRICKDIDECRTALGNCEHRCGNTLGSYQCHCNEGYSLQGNKCKRDTPPCAVEQLPVPRNSSVNCKTMNAVLECKLKCHHMFKFGSSQNFSIQNCNDGVWDYQRDEIHIPDCQPLKERVAVIKGHMESNETCLAHQKFREFHEEDALLPVVIEAKCKQLSGSRQNGSASEGTLVITFTFLQVIPFSCGSACIQKIQFPLHLWFEEVQQRVASGLALVIENLETSDLVNVTLHGKLHRGNDNVQITCQSGQMLSEDICIPCAPGSFLNSTGPTATCDPCPFHYYQDESEQAECKACPNGTFTIARGSNECGHCRAPCSPGTASWSGLVPCKECKKGFYQPESGANFCHKCDFGQMTHSSGSERKEDCGCPAGTYWNDCLEKCPCSNGGICELDGSCICPQGLTGPYCTKKDVFRACHDSYLIPFGKNADNQQMRRIFALTGANNGSVSVTMKFTDESTSHVSDYHIGSEDQLDLQFLPTVTVVHISVSRGISILGDIDEEEDGDTFAALPIFPILGETKFEEYLVLSHASKNLLTNVMGVILVVAATDNTQVIVTPAENISDVEGGRFLEKNNVTVFVQHRLNTLTLTSVNDLTGTVIRADKPIAVYSGHVCGNTPVHVSSCDHLIEQMPPVRVLGYCYIVTSFMGRQDGSYVKFVAAVDGTFVEVHENGKVLPIYGPLDQGTFRERYVGPGKVLVLKSSHPILVAQVGPGAQLDDIGAPFMIVLPSLSQLVSEVPFYSKNNSDVNYFHYITITVPSQYYDEDAIILDGDPIHSNATTTVQSPLCGNFTLASLEVAPGHHYLQHTTPGAGFLLSVYGFALETSYGYSPGLNQVLSCDGPYSSMEGHQE